MKRYLPFQPQARHAESVRSYLYRLAEGNLYERRGWLLGVRDLAEFLRPIVEDKTSGAKPDWLVLLLHGRRRAHGGLPGPRYKVMSEARFCPICLREGYWRAEWEYLYYTSCHLHEVELKSTCEKCNVPSSWPRPKLMFCKCGADFSSQTTSPASPLEVMLSREVLASERSLPALDLLPIRTVTGSDKFEDVCSFIRAIGKHYNQRYAPNARNLPVPDLDLARTHVQQTATILSNWPDSFQVFLRQFAQLDTAEPQSYFRSAALSNLLRALLKFDRMSPLATETRNLLSALEPTVWDKRHYGPYPKHQVSMPSKFSYITPAARRLNVSKKMVKQLIADGELHAISRPRGRRDFTLIPTGELTQAQSSLTDRISHKETARLLGISSNRLTQLHEAELFSAGKTRTGYPIYYSHKQLNRFLGDFKVGEDQHHCSDSRSLKSIAKYITSCDREFVAIIRALMNRDLRIVHYEKALGALAGMHVSQSEFTEWRAQKQIRNLLIDEAAQRLKLKQEVTYHLVRKGLIKSSREKVGRRTCRIIRQEDLDEFIQKYISAVEMAKMYGTSPQSLVYRLFRKSIQPETGPAVDGGRQYFYLRSHLSYSDNVFRNRALRSPT